MIPRLKRSAGHPTAKKADANTSPAPLTVQRVAVNVATVPPGLHYSPGVVQRAAATGGGQALPGGLRTGIESLSGLDMSGVRVHYGSPLPAQLNALAYAQGSDIHLARGQEKHLPHEAWHVVQQSMGRVKPTMNLGGVNINDNAALESEADQMGARALQCKASPGVAPPVHEAAGGSIPATVGQRKVLRQSSGKWISSYDPYTVFSTQFKASIYDKKLRAGGRPRLSSRVPTLYSYTHIKPHNKLSSVPQGPHVAAHRLTLTALQNTTDVDGVEEIFDEQVLAPDDVDEVMEEEAPSNGYSTQIQPRVDRYVTDYRQIYTSIETELAKTTPDLITLKHGVNTLMNMDPYATYGWKTTKPASKKHTKGKGENVTSPTFSDLVDNPPGNSISNTDAFDSFVDSRKDLFNAHF
ncbi:DUF4157 domain-containing protein [Dyella subtropica]|uniref:eCIS core domain-containing protein n=1 Tax=Dyella subtropica TaxID=2992127 RepID=UPI002258ED11|nr:DUF4157 domain-containing protein [Dyella subtropica]